MDEFFNRVDEEGFNVLPSHTYSDDYGIEEMDIEASEEDFENLDIDFKEEALLRRLETLEYTGRSYPIGETSDYRVPERDQLEEIVVTKIYKDKSVKAHRIIADDLDYIDNLGPGLRPYVELEVELTREMIKYGEIELIGDNFYEFLFFFDQRSDAEIDVYFKDQMTTAMYNKRKDRIQGLGEMMDFLGYYFQLGQKIILRYYYYADLIEII